MLKLISKQLITPKDVDKPLYHLAPLLAFVPVIAAVSLFPLSRDFVMVQNDLGLLFIFALGGVAVLAIFMAGWGSNNKYALLGAIRSVAQNISYEIPLILSALSVVLVVNATGPTLGVGEAAVATNGLDLSHIVMAQDQRGFWFILVQPVAALIYFISALAETNRAPFDIPEAESELVAGFHTEYSGMRFSLFFFAEYSNMLVVSMLAAVLFLGGWDGPVLPGPVWFFLKSYAVIFVMMWIRWTFPRLRFDQLITFCWKVLIPFSILNLLATALVVAMP
jgi:NADH-quinone oxidoreductase subunit H